jgi:AcrR family transcriptional regulator
MEGGPRQRVLSAAMRLFGVQGYSGTTISQIESAAGLSPGSGALYRHFPSKRAILEAGITAAIAEPAELGALVENPAELADLPLEQRLVVVARAGLVRLRDQRDLNRLVLRDLARFDDLLALVRDQEIGRFYAAFAAWLASQPEAAARPGDVDWEAVAMVLMGSVSHYWIMVDTLGRHPVAIDEERYLAAAARLAAALLDPGSPR